MDAGFPVPLILREIFFQGGHRKRSTEAAPCEFPVHSPLDRTQIGFLPSGRTNTSGRPMLGRFVQAPDGAVQLRFHEESQLSARCDRQGGTCSIQTNVSAPQWGQRNRSVCSGTSEADSVTGSAASWLMPRHCRARRPYRFCQRGFQYPLPTSRICDVDTAYANLASSAKNSWRILD